MFTTSAILDRKLFHDTEKFRVNTGEVSKTHIKSSLDSNFNALYQYLEQLYP